jgi:hypothetical protein
VAESPTVEADRLPRASQGFLHTDLWFTMRAAPQRLTATCADVASNTLRHPTPAGGIGRLFNAFGFCACGEPA